MGFSEKFLSVFNGFYDDLYNGKIRENRTLIIEFDRRLKTDNAFKALVSFFNETRKDILSSDREVNAFMLTIERVSKGF